VWANCQEFFTIQRLERTVTAELKMDNKPSVFFQVEPFLLLKFTTGLQSSVHVIKELLW
jgi:hypothetical protein